MSAERTPWYLSVPVIVLASILLPPAGIYLTWKRPGAARQTKSIATVILVGLTVIYVVAAFGRQISSVFFVRSPDMEAHYEELERQRAEQRRNSPATQSGTNATQIEAGTETAPSPAAVKSGAEAATVAANPARNYWTNYRGPARDGRYDEAAILTNWSSSGPPLLWKQPIGNGYASFVVADGTAFTIEQRRRQEVVAAYDVETGREIWTHTWNAEFTEETGDGPRATPTWDDGKIYTLGAQGDLACLDAKTGRPNWSRNILSDNGADNLPWGMAASPLVVDDKVIVLPGGKGGKSVVAYNKNTGAPIWKALDDRAAYVAPMLVTLAGQRQVLVETSRRVVGLRVEDGGLLWEYPWTTDMGINCSQPIIVGANRFFVSSGYGKGAAVVEVSRDGDRFTPNGVWQNTNMKNKFNSSVYYDGYVYGLDEGILTCVDVATGERKWKGGRYGYGQMILASGHLVITTDTGDLVLVKATPDQLTEVARTTVLQGRTWNYPAMAGGRLLIRNQTEMACLNIAAN
jgi:outer membrane protein assembly factor BamB